MFKTERCHYGKSDNEKSLEELLNEIAKIGMIKFITSDYYGNGEVGYTIIYDTFIL